MPFLIQASPFTQACGQHKVTVVAGVAPQGNQMPNPREATHLKGAKCREYIFIYTWPLFNQETYTDTWRTNSIQKGHALAKGQPKDLFAVVEFNLYWAFHKRGRDCMLKVSVIAAEVLWATFWFQILLNMVNPLLEHANQLEVGKKTYFAKAKSP